MCIMYTIHVHLVLCTCIVYMNINISISGMTFKDGQGVISSIDGDGGASGHVYIKGSMQH